jgi:hypothetical protein
MNPRLLLTTSALAMGVTGIAGTFAPVEIATSLGAGAPLVVQLLAALLFSCAMVNWMARGSLIGGIYNRPIAVGNLAHFVIGALVLAKAVIAGERRLAFVVSAGIYIVFAVAFGAVLFRSPVRPGSHTDDPTAP